MKRSGEETVEQIVKAIISNASALNAISGNPPSVPSTTQNTSSTNLSDKRSKKRGRPSRDSHSRNNKRHKDNQSSTTSSSSSSHRKKHHSSRKEHNNNNNNSTNTNSEPSKNPLPQYSSTQISYPSYPIPSSTHRPNIGFTSSRGNSSHESSKVQTQDLNLHSRSLYIHPKSSSLPRPSSSSSRTLPTPLVIDITNKPSNPSPIILTEQEILKISPKSSVFLNGIPSFQAHLIPNPGFIKHELLSSIPEFPEINITDYWKITEFSSFLSKQTEWMSGSFRGKDETSKQQSEILRKKLKNEEVVGVSYLLLCTIFVIDSSLICQVDKNSSKPSRSFLQVYITPSINPLDYVDDESKSIPSEIQSTVQSNSLIVNPLEPTCHLMVTHILYSVEEDDIRQNFEKYGRITLFYFHKFGKEYEYDKAWISFASKEEAMAAKQYLATLFLPSNSKYTRKRKINLHFVKCPFSGTLNPEDYPPLRQNKST